jgi:hypothetical protein
MKREKFNAGKKTSNTKKSQKTPPCTSTTKQKQNTKAITTYQITKASP